ncbi:MAG: nickel pincer cofactor biosynthesis protein LarC [Erysipelotrichaceae bacterium]|nr:nickel pincer cofactor biosynthesis protein LarC [Erysipelotrichaceae bacterium]
MKTVFIDCSMGAAGDMLTAALLELTDDPVRSLEELNQLGIPGVVFEAEKAQKNGIGGTHVHVLVNGEEEGVDDHHHDHHDHDHDHDHEHHHDHDHEHHEHDHEHGHHHHHSGMHDIEHIVKDHLNVSDEIKEKVMAVYHVIADAESKVHGTSVDQVHFHEVGSMDAVADITAVCYLISKLDPDQVIASPVHVGRGTVKCAHGIIPVPAPATALILKDVPIYSKENVEGELCTPTGAALLKTFASDFVQMPVMKIEKIGYGIGTKDFKVANCLRIYLGETESRDSEKIYELSFNVDDMTGEQIGYATKVLLENNARDVFTTPVYMKKNRPGTMISVICDDQSRDELVRLIFRHTSTLGIRQTIHDRYVLKRDIESLDTEFGTIRIKNAEGYGVSKSKYEYDDLIRAAEENDLSIEEIKRRIK